jgi:hypothetical protein
MMELLVLKILSKSASPLEDVQIAQKMSQLLASLFGTQFLLHYLKAPIRDLLERQWIEIGQRRSANAFYALSKAGEAALTREQANWLHLSSAITRAVQTAHVPTLRL